MNITFWLNGVKRQAEVRPDELLLDFLRKNSCYSVKHGCETANCGLCTVLMDERPVLSCSMLAARADGKRIPHKTHMLIYDITIPGTDLRCCLSGQGKSFV